MQQRGAVHYHVVLAVRHGARMPKPDDEGLWPHGLTGVELVRYVYAYLSKYLQKDGQKAKFPRGIRTFGYSYLWRPGDDPEVRHIEDFLWHGEALPEKLDGHSGVLLNPTGRIPTDDELEALDARRKAQAGRK